MTNPNCVCKSPIPIEDCKFASCPISPRNCHGCGLSLPIAKEPEGKCCLKCLMTPEAFKAGKMPSCLATDCPCHSKPVEESWEGEFDEMYDIRPIGDFSEQLVPNSLEKSPIKSFIANLLSKARQEGRNEAVDYIASKVDPGLSSLPEILLAARRGTN